jgi:putative transposase
MDGNFWRPAHLTPKQLEEERRLVAATLLRQGRLSQAQIARQLGASRASVSRWAVTFAQEAGAAWRLDPFRDRCPASMRGHGLGRLLDRGAMAAGFGTKRWTLNRIAALIEREFGVHYHPRYLERPLKAHGFSVQRPATQAKEREVWNCWRRN